jgi:hypothetical protein
MYTGPAQLDTSDGWPGQPSLIQATVQPNLIQATAVQFGEMHGEVGLSKR